MSRNGSLKRINKKLKKYYGYSYTDLLEVINNIVTKMEDCVVKVNAELDEAVASKDSLNAVDSAEVLASNLKLFGKCFTEINTKLLDVTESIRNSYLK